MEWPGQEPVYAVLFSGVVATGSSVRGIYGVLRYLPRVGVSTVPRTYCYRHEAERNLENRRVGHHEEAELPEAAASVSGPGASLVEPLHGPRSQLRLAVDQSS